MSALALIDLASHFKTYAGEIFRLVEGQHFIATRKLVDSDDEQRILEDILDASKPSAPVSNKRGELHYLLYTPFRYPPLKAGGRFHTRFEQSIFYGSQDLKTAMAEVAYGRFLFMSHSDAQFAPMQVPYTHFVVRVKSTQSLLLQNLPFTQHREAISQPSSYNASQTLGSAMRECGTQIFTYLSARQNGGVNVGLFSVEAFAQNKPVSGKDGHWEVFITSNSVEYHRARATDNHKEAHVFTLNTFCNDGKFVAVA